jgi:hypothetical protein
MASRARPKARVVRKRFGIGMNSRSRKLRSFLDS